ncbi:MAG: 2-amino-4-hydroxy-6-hydroxymethyldihydropteridine diphosphokinase, partial [Peptococcaceae bacterium]|nr:2-amino-4-hydroxy-6-hydroxymethyldihydropteridine diphosphokinase [Peptococcaceae bacterium]
LQTIHTIEAAQGRQRLVHWGPRTLDIDIIYYDDLLLDQPDLTIPHPLSLQRAFVMDPVASIVPYWIDPRYGKTISALWQPAEE